MAMLLDKINSLGDLYLANLVDEEYYRNEVAKLYKAEGFAVPPIKLPQQQKREHGATQGNDLTVEDRPASVPQIAPVTVTNTVPVPLFQAVAGASIPEGCPSPKKSKKDKRMRAPWVTYTDSDGHVPYFASKEEAKEFANNMCLTCQWSSYRAKGGSNSAGELRKRKHIFVFNMVDSSI